MKHWRELVEAMNQVAVGQAPGGAGWSPVNDGARAARAPSVPRRLTGAHETGAWITDLFARAQACLGTKGFNRSLDHTNISRNSARCQDRASA